MKYLINLIFIVILTVSVIAKSVYAQETVANKIEDESLIVPVRIAVRANDLDLAKERLDAITKPRIKAMANGSFAFELANKEQLDEAGEYIAIAQDQIRTGDMRTYERVVANLYLAKLFNQDENFPELTDEFFNESIKYIERLSGIDLDLAITELAYAQLEIYQDREEAYQILQLMTDAKLREKLINILGLSDLAS